MLKYEIDPETGLIDTRLPLDTVYAVLLPENTTIYVGGVAYQGGLYLGTPHKQQVFVLNTSSARIVDSWKLPR